MLYDSYYSNFSLHAHATLQFTCHKKLRRIFVLPCEMCIRNVALQFFLVKVFALNRNTHGSKNTSFQFESRSSCKHLKNILEFYLFLPVD